jgi:integrase
MGRGPGVRTTSASSIGITFVWKGQRERERLRLPPTPANLRYAKRLKATIDHEIAKGTFDYARHFPDSPRAQRRGGVTLSGALRAYVQSVRQSLEPETADKYSNDAEAFAEAIGSDTPLEGLTRARVRQWANDSGLSKKRLDNILIPVRGAIRQAIEDGSLQFNPLAEFQIRRVAKPGSSIDPFTPEEVASLGATALGDLWTLWAWTGLRSGEIIGLRLGDVDGETRSLCVGRAVRVGREKSPKTAAGTRTLALLPAARSALYRLVSQRRGLAPETPLVVNPNTGERWHEDRGLARAFRKACGAAGVRYRYPYQLRHTFATWALSSGENPAWIARYMGHSDVMMLFRVYGKWMPSLDPQAGSRMAKRAAAKAA